MDWDWWLPWLLDMVVFSSLTLVALLLLNMLARC